MLTWLLALGTIRYDKFELHTSSHMAFLYCVFNCEQARNIRQFIAVAPHVYHVLSTKAF